MLVSVLIFLKLENDVQNFKKHDKIRDYTREPSPHFKRRQPKGIEINFHALKNQKSKAHDFENKALQGSKYAT